MKAGVIRDSEGRFYGVRFKCPGCLYSDGEMQTHTVIVPAPEGEEASPHTAGRPVWGWNGSLESPTFTPSINTWFTGESGVVTYRCHSLVTDGKGEDEGDGA
jgi:hypothetical protein